MQVITTPSFIGVDVPLDDTQFALKSFLVAFADVSKQRPFLHLALTGRRSPTNSFSVANCLQDMDLQERVSFLPYYAVCQHFPRKKIECDAWIDRHLLKENMTASRLIQHIDKTPRQKSALFFTSFHPGKYEGNSCLMRLWLRCLRLAGYVIHLVHYNIERLKPDLTTEALADFDFYHEIECTTRLVGYNQNGQNVHVDDWCGSEALETVQALVSNHAFDLAIVNYAFMSAVFDVLPSYTKKILLTHDAFRDRNKRMLLQGFAESGWVSLDAEGEAMACERADIVVALQKEEHSYFEALCRDHKKIWTIQPAFEKNYEISNHLSNRIDQDQRLRVGYVASSNWVNEANMGLFLESWIALPDAISLAKIIIAGSFSKEIFSRVHHKAEGLLEVCQPVLLGKQRDLALFYAGCDVIINPERGGTGIKIKTLEALARGKAVLTTMAGSVGLDSDSPYHRAADVSDLARLLHSVAQDRSHLCAARKASISLYDKYFERSSGAIDRLIGPPQPVERRNARVSIIIPFYNVQPFLPECMESVLSQTYPNMEVILVDDGSTDGSKDLVGAYMERDSRVHLISHASNAGLGPARDSGVKAAKGDFLFFLDSDDSLSSPASIEILMSLAEGSGVSVIAGASQRLGTDGLVSDYDLAMAPSSDRQSPTPLFGEDAFAAVMGFSDHVYFPMRAWGILIARNYYCQLGIQFPAFEHEDMATMPFVCRSAPRGILYTHRPVVRYRERPGSLSMAIWTVEKVDRYKQLWLVFKKRAKDYDLDGYLSDSGLLLIAHMLWRLEAGPPTRAAKRAALDLALVISEDINETRFQPFFKKQLSYIRSLHKNEKLSSGFFTKLYGVVPAFSRLIVRLRSIEQTTCSG